jgi:hypothetical protein
MFYAFALPVGLFFALPLTVVALVGPGGSERPLNMLASAAFVLAPLYAVGYLLAPWAGRSAPRTKAPAFVMAAASALAPVVALLTWAVIRGEPGGAYGAALFFSAFALPASLLGALLFIGRCQRLHSGSIR